MPTTRGPFTLGAILGSLSYLGACAHCRRQFMSTHDRVYLRGQPGASITICPACAGKETP